MKHYLISVLILSMLNFDVHSMKRKRQEEEAPKGAQQHIVETKRSKQQEVIEESEKDSALIVKNSVDKLQLLDLPQELICYILNKLLPEPSQPALKIIAMLNSAIIFISSSRALKMIFEYELIHHIRKNANKYENIQDYSGNNLLVLAVNKGKYQVACIMLKAFNNAEKLINKMIETDCLNHKFPIHLYKLRLWLMCNGHNEIANIICEHHENMQCILILSPWKKLLFDGKSAFHAAVDNSSFECIATMLLSWEADVDAQDVNGHTPLTYAIKRGNLDIIEFLITNRANPNISDNTHLDLNPFLQAIISGNPETIKLLIPYVSDINGKNKFGLTPLLCAKLVLIGQENYAEITNILKENGALEADFENCDKVTMLILAIDKNCLPGIKLLIEQGASLSSKYYHSYGDMYPLDYAAYIDNLDAAKLLIDNYNPTLDIVSAIEFSAANNNRQMFELVYTHYQFKVKNESEEEEFTRDLSKSLSDALKYAISSKNLAFIKRLIELSCIAKISLEDNPLNIAIKIKDLNKQLEIMEFLIKQGIDVNRPSNDNIIPLHHAVELGYPSAVNLLLKNGADIYQTNMHNQTVCHLVCNDEQINLLLKKAAKNFKSK